MPWEARMQTLYTLDELLVASENKLNISTIKHHCRLGELHPCLYFEGNIICIHEERFQNGLDKRDPIAHSRTVSWSKAFKGYIYVTDFIDYIDHSNSETGGVFFDVEKIIDYISPNTEFPYLKQDEYLKALPKMIDDDIQEKRWLHEIKYFEGNPFKSKEIVFHVNEVKNILNPNNKPKPVAFLDYSDRPFLTKLFKNDFFTPIEAACLISKDDPDIIVLLYKNNKDQFKMNYPRTYDALVLIQRAIELEILKSVNETDIPQLDLAEFLVNRGYVINNFNKRNFEGRCAPYLFYFEGRKRSKPVVIDFSNIEDPLSEINYLRFKVSKQLIEIEKLKFLSSTVSGTKEPQVNTMITQVDPNQYLTPALKAIKGVIQEFWIKYNPETDIAPKQSTVMDWIGDNYPEFTNNDYMKKCIDKICRHPNAKTGGNSKIK